MLTIRDEQLRAQRVLRREAFERLDNLAGLVAVDDPPKMDGITPGAVEGLLILDDHADTHRVRFGYIDPIDTINGMQSRLRALGYFGGATDGVPSPEFDAAVQTFQHHCDLPVTGTINDATTAAMLLAFGS
jgi:peptidoglycan hydrolase-like protein with peptidoglycan-binding domain